MNALRPKPVSTAFYLVSYIGGSILGGILLVIGIVGIAGGAAAAEDGNEAGKVFAGVGGLLLVLGILFCLYAFIISMVLYYKMWDAIQDGHARTTPGMAVGLMFIPFFNLYWMFQAIWGYSKDYNAYLQRHQVAAQPLPENLFLIYCIMTIASMVPYVGGLVALACLVILIILLVKICGAINALANAPVAVAAAQPGELPRENWRGL